MKTYEITYQSVNTPENPKRITALIIEPDQLDSETGAMLFTHGCGANRFFMQQQMEYTADKFNIVCISVEFRQSGYDFDPVRGIGYERPYDSSFYQIFDVLNGLRTVLDIHQNINRRRIFHYGCSQGGHIAYMSAIFAPETFAFIYSSSGVTRFDENLRFLPDRDFSEAEIALRNVHNHLHMIKCPVYIEHGTADVVVDCNTHSKSLAEKLDKLDLLANAEYYINANHILQPTTNHFEAFKEMATEPMQKVQGSNTDDFQLKSKITIDCKTKNLIIDWSQPKEAESLFTF